ncbi:hypothetical protein O5O45_12490 [Hahella aquimaris]|uniref:hypothetical protein n=1 Tax=Hahella sp. HNIBRBA332 TaxID=3015983 RepID=UPI00273ADA8D|nr:hypothetical protein [Hahella sp. HNIBRBA332]WLQ16736.1 hypothetical protein O5O45_12490 [Hahella sp. HNIBRBA332]
MPAKTSTSLVVKIIKLSLLLIPAILAYFPIKNSEEFRYFFAPKVVYEVKGYQNDDNGPEDMEILTSRISRLGPGLFSSADFMQDDGKAFIVLTRGAANPNLVEFVSQHPGNFVMRGETPEDIWYTNQDIAESKAVSPRGDDIAVSITVTDEAYAKSGKKINDNVGGFGYVTLDGTIISKAHLQIKLGKSIMLTGYNNSDAKGLVAILSGDVMSRAYTLVRM